MASAKLSTFVHPDGKVVLSWASSSEDGVESGGAISLAPVEARNLASALMGQSIKAAEIESLFASVEDVFKGDAFPEI